MTDGPSEDGRVAVEVDGWATDLLRHAMVTGANGELNPHIEAADPERARAWLVLECMFGAEPDLVADPADVAAYARSQEQEMRDYANEVRSVPDTIVMRMGIYQAIAEWAEGNL